MFRDFDLESNEICLKNCVRLFQTVFLLILCYVYTGILDLTNQSSSNILALLVACDELMLDKLVNHVQKHLINQESSWLQENFIFALLTVLKLPSCKEIQDYIMKTIYLMAYLMANIIPKISNLPSRCGSINIDSVIIERNKAAVITNWIEKRTNFARKPFYQFTLTYRATRDGFNQNTFNAKNQNNAILGLIKIKDSKKIIGGYSPLGFKGHNYNGHRYGYYEQWESTNDSFIFCFGDEESPPTILSRVKDSSCAIYSYSGSWINFGNSDLVLNGQNGSCSQCYYENKILDTNNFVVEDLETFIMQIKN
ncbi:serine-enriched protein [Gigaspora margarita]|uniref:Serine-enriched protein n=1 Tax=Gigaspora margarita TaxID=4874 RepID=A0A8H4EL59_GIGMA|nr:serine-enriched protein [Gigaspora margarita]